MNPSIVLFFLVFVCVLVSVLVGYCFNTALTSYWNVRVTELFQVLTAAVVLPYIAYMYQNLLVRHNKRIETRIKIMEFAETKIHTFLQANLLFMENQPGQRNISDNEVLHGFKMARSHVDLIKKLCNAQKSSSRASNKTIDGLYRRITTFQDLMTGIRWNLSDPLTLTYNEEQKLKARTLIEEITIGLQESKVALLSD